VEYLVTGGAGFIGSNIARQLVSEGCEVGVVDNLATGRRSNIEDLLGRVDFTEGDVSDQDVCRSVVKGVRYVLHLAALPSVPRSVEDPATSNTANVDGTLQMLLAARDAGVERFVFSSSSSVYGDTPVLPKREDMKPMPLSPYALQKLAGEHYCRVFHSLYGFKTFSLRYFNVFGPRQDPTSQYAAVVPRFIEAFHQDRPPTIYGDGGQTRDFTFVADVVAANIACCKAPEAAAGEVYNAAGGTQTSVIELASAIGGIMGKDITPVHEAPRPGDVRDSLGDGAKARDALGWETQVPMEEGLAKTVEFFTA